MRFRGRTSSAGDEQRLLHTSGSATSCLVRALIRPSGLDSEITVEAGGFAYFESDLLPTGSDGFQENGAITFGDASEHLLRFSTVGEGHMSSAVAPGVIAAGSATSKVEGGAGQFAEARGFITTTFTLSDTGERCDYHCGLIFLPE
jgi:hypothetical protein